MKITLVFPRLTDNYDILGGSNWVVSTSMQVFGLGQTSLTPPLSLLMLAAVTPPGVEVKTLVNSRPVGTAQASTVESISSLNKNAYHD